MAHLIPRLHAPVAIPEPVAFVGKEIASYCLVALLCIGWVVTLPAPPMHRAYEHWLLSL